MKKEGWRGWTPNMERRWRKWAPKMKKTRWRLSHVGGTNDIVARKVRRWKEKKWTFHTSINGKIKGPVVRKRMKVQRILGINSLILIERIIKKIRGPSQVTKKEEFKILLLSSNKGPHCGGRYIGPYVISQRIDKRTYRIDTNEGKKQIQVCHANKLKRYVRQEGPPRKIKNSGNAE